MSDDQVMRYRVRLLLESIPMGLLSAYFAAAMTAWLLYSAVSHSWLAWWLAVLALIHLVRVVGWYRARKASFALSQESYLGILRIGVLATALAWTALPLFLYPSGIQDQLLVATVVAAICGAGASELAADARSTSLFVLPTMTVMILRLVLSPEPAMRALGVMALVYGIYLIKSSYKTERVFLEISYLRAKAADKVNFDEVTELLNRAGLNRLLQEAVVEARRRGKSLAVGYLDLDDFKPINDTYGHAAGDRVLKLLGQRLRKALREGDAVARVSGDEFVVVLRDIDPDQLRSELDTVFGRLHHAVEEPFKLDDGRSVLVDMTMGAAIYPHHAQDADALLRVADAAMYQVKRRKGEREIWWQLGVHKVVAPEVETPIDPYGEEAARRLVDIAPFFTQVRDRFIEEFYDTLKQDDETKAILRALDEKSFAGLKRNQAAYLHSLMEPGLTRESAVASARRTGLVHALVGVNASMLVKASDMFRSILGERLASERLLASRRYRLFKVIEARLQDDIHEQIAVIEHTSQSYLSYLSRERSEHGALWADAVRAELDEVLKLPGVVMVTLTRLTARGEMVLEHSAGIPYPELSERLSHGDLHSSIDPSSPNGRTGTSIAWRTQEIHRIDSCPSDTRVLEPSAQRWQNMAHSIGVQSNVSIPFSGRNGHVEGVLTIYGKYPRQFASTWMQQWSLGVERRLEAVWARCSDIRSTVVSQAQSVAYRDRLFSGGLEMHYQPILDLRSGRPIKVEALARLKMSDGQVVSPSAFISLLGDNELGRVFREGLDQSLESLRIWDASGLQLAASVNLPPSILLDPHCADWIDAALQAHAISPQRLTLELLEVELGEDKAYGEGMDRLRKIGVGLAMDDFGTGYSNIHRLLNMHFDAIKIDQDLAKQLRRNPQQTMTLLGTLVQLVRDLGQDVIVEGLEDLGSLEVATILGARFGQGYAISPPMPRDAVKPWSASYRMPINTRSFVLNTYLGALAFHWFYDKVGGQLHPLDATQCPLHRFLVDRGFADSEVIRWHANVHADKANATDASMKLMRWLAARVSGQAGQAESVHGSAEALVQA